MTSYNPLRTLPGTPPYGAHDTLVVFGEVFDRGYANGVIMAAEALGMEIVYGTAGRRDSDGALRPLTAEELAEKQQSPLVNMPLEAGFDLEKSASGTSVADEMGAIDMANWQDWTLDPGMLDEVQAKGEARFAAQTRAYLAELKKTIKGTGRIVFLHTMAGGIPRARSLLAVTNRIFKGFDDRYSSSEAFWVSDLGKACERSFESVTANTLQHLIDETKSWRDEREVAYLAFGYHGTECLIGGKSRWQSYAPYLQGWAKMKLEQVAEKAFAQGVKVAVFNAPEVATNSSGIFLGVEMGLYTLLGRLRADGVDISELERACKARLKPDVALATIEAQAQAYFTDPSIAYLFDDSTWPQHNSPAQMKTMCTTAAGIIDMHQDKKELIGQLLSEVVVTATGRLMLYKSAAPERPVWWLGHDIISAMTKQAANGKVLEAAS
jgi:hypothetical protein